MNIVHRAIEALEPAARNPKRHDLERIKASIRRHGFVTPLVVNEKTERLVAGHGRLAALLEMLAEAEERPARIVLGAMAEWMVPVIEVPFETEAEAEAYLLADNRIVELGGWDQDALQAMLRDEPALAKELDFPLLADVEFKAFDEAAAEEVEFWECPKCGHKEPK